MSKPLKATMRARPLQSQGKPEARKSLADQEPLTTEFVKELMMSMDNQYNKDGLNTFVNNCNRLQSLARHYQLELAIENEKLRKRLYEYNSAIKEQRSVVESARSKLDDLVTSNAPMNVISNMRAKLQQDLEVLATTEKTRRGFSAPVEVDWSWERVLPALCGDLSILLGHDLPTGRTSFFIQTAQKLVFKITGEEEDCSRIYEAWRAQLRKYDDEQLWREVRVDPPKKTESEKREAHALTIARQLISAEEVDDETSASSFPIQPADPSKHPSGPGAWINRTYARPSSEWRPPFQFPSLETDDAK